MITKIKVWTNDNLLDVVTQNTYYRAAISNSRYAFASDVARMWRMWVLLNEGGIYLDSDIELKKSFNPILNKEITIICHSNNDDFIAKFTHIVDALFQ